MLLTLGLSMRDIREIPTGHLMDLARLHREGVVGWNERSNAVYMVYAMLSTLIGTVSKALGGSPGKALQAHEYAPFVSQMRRFGVEHVEHKLMAFMDRMASKDAAP